MPSFRLYPCMMIADISLPTARDNDYVSKLNPEQRTGVEAVEGAVLILAGAGTGKTRVLTTRIAHILDSGTAYPSQILAVTFTNKAAKEMVERVDNLISPPAPEASENPAAGMNNNTNGMWLGTFHAIAARILRRHAEMLGLTSSFTILDADDQLRLVKTLMKEKNIDDKMYPAKGVYATIQAWKDRALLPAQITEQHHQSPNSALAQQVYADYQRRLVAINACDFGDLLLHNLALFRSTDEQGKPHILLQYQQKFRYILVDEYQDTNIAQYIWLKLLAMGHGNICCVGDDDQSIYGWRGAEVGNILKFEQEYPGATIVRLEQNYRSTHHILSAASALIDCNKGRLGKTLWTDLKGGEKIRVKSIWDDSEEARYVGEEIETLQRDKISLSDMAILVRAGFQTRSFEERLLTLGVAYKVIGGLRFYERLEIRDAIAYLRMINQPRDDLAFERIVNTPRRGIGKTTLEQLHGTARSLNISLVEATDAALKAGSLKGKAKGALGQLMQQRKLWAEKAETTPPNILLEKVLEESGYLAMWKQDKSPEATGRLENIQELIRALSEFETVNDFIEHIALVMDKDANATGEMLSIMTLHAAKGLEFDSVFLTGWEEGLFPHQRALDESGNKGLEEERRLAYVGITRAKRLLTISHAANRRIYNQWQSSIPSRFLAELPEADIEELEGGPQTRRASGPQLMQSEIEKVFSEAQRVSYPSQHTAGAASAQHKAKAGFFARSKRSHEIPSSSSTKSALVGKKVNHVKFGEGKVIATDGKTLDIQFSAGRKKIMKDFVQFD